MAFYALLHEEILMKIKTKVKAGGRCDGGGTVGPGGGVGADI
jgi:hypothetical protein